MTHHTQDKTANGGRAEFNLLLLAVFAVMLVAVAVGRLLPRRMRWNVSGHDEGKSIIGAAKSAAYSTTPFAFM